MEIRTSVGYVSVRRSVGKRWEVSRKPYRAAGSNLGRILRHIGVPPYELNRVKQAVLRRFPA